jgi:hypothetical protein
VYEGLKLIDISPPSPSWHGGCRVSPAFSMPSNSKLTKKTFFISCNVYKIRLGCIKHMRPKFVKVNLGVVNMDLQQALMFDDKKSHYVCLNRIGPCGRLQWKVNKRGLLIRKELFDAYKLY